MIDPGTFDVLAPDDSELKPLPPPPREGYDLIPPPGEIIGYFEGFLISEYWSKKFGKVLDEQGIDESLLVSQGAIRYKQIFTFSDGTMNPSTLSMENWWPMLYMKDYKNIPEEFSIRLAKILDDEEI